MVLSALLLDHRSIVYSLLTTNDVHQLQSTCWAELQNYTSDRRNEWKSIQTLNGDSHLLASLVKQCDLWFQYADVKRQAPLMLRDLSIQRVMHHKIDRLVTIYLRIGHLETNEPGSFLLFSDSLSEYLQFRSQVEDSANQTMAVSLNTFYERLQENNYIEAGKALLMLRDEENIVEKWRWLLPNLPLTPEGFAIKDQLRDPRLVALMFEDEIVQMEGPWKANLFNLWKRILDSILSQDDKDNLSDMIIDFVKFNFHQEVRTTQETQHFLTMIQEEIACPFLCDKLFNELVKDCLERHRVTIAERIAHLITNQDSRNQCFEAIADARVIRNSDSQKKLESQCKQFVIRGQEQDLLNCVNQLHDRKLQVLLLSRAIQQVPVKELSLQAGLSQQIFYLNQAIDHAKSQKDFTLVVKHMNGALVDQFLQFYQENGLENVITLINQINHPSYQDALLDLLGQYFITNNCQTAVELFYCMHSPTNQDLSYSKAIHWLLDQGNVDFAEKICDEFNDTFIQSTTYQSIALDHDDLVKSYQIALKILDPAILSTTYAELCERYVDDNQFHESFELAQQIPVWWIKCRVVSKLIQKWLAKHPINSDNQDNQQVILFALNMYRVMDQFLYLNAPKQAFQAIQERADLIHYTSEYYETILLKPPVDPESEAEEASEYDEGDEGDGLALI